MNCITDFVTEYHSKYGLIENVSIISLTDDDCAIEICSNKSLIKTSIVRLKILTKPHGKLHAVEDIDTKQNYILSTDEYSCIVRPIKIHEDKMIEVMPISDLSLNNEATKQVSVEDMQICGEYENFDALKSVSISMPREYCRYFNNISIFKPLLSRTKNVMLCWNAEELKLKVLALEESSLKKIEFLMPVFIIQLSLLISGKQSKTIDLLSPYIVWEYQYENEEEANYAIGPKGTHILAVRNFKGIAGVVLTKTNRLRIIAENITALKEARSLLEIKRETYMFDDSFIPILIGKNANHISELVSKAGLHCIYVPNSPWNGTVKDCITINDPSMQGKRELFLYGTRDSIISAKLLLEMEESVKDLKKEFELRKNSKLRQSFSLKSSTSSISRESDKQATNSDEKAAQELEVFEEPLSMAAINIDNDDHDININDKCDKISELAPSHSLLWADQQDESDEDCKATEIPVGSGGGGSVSVVKEDYTDFFSSQLNPRNRRTNKKAIHNNNSWISQPAISQQSPERQASYGGPNHRPHWKQPKLSSQQTTAGVGGGGCGSNVGGGMLFTNSSLASSEVMIDDKEDYYQYGSQGKQFGVVRNNSRNHQQHQHQQQQQYYHHHHHHHNSTGNSSSANNNKQNWNNHYYHNFRQQKGNDRRSYPSNETTTGGAGGNSSAGGYVNSMYSSSANQSNM